jgi:hypothetical protein
MIHGYQGTLPHSPGYPTAFPKFAGVTLEEARKEIKAKEAAAIP